VNIDPEIAKMIKTMLGEAKTFEEKKWAVETAMKFTLLKLKAKGDKTGKFFSGDDDEGATDDDGDTF
jgi:hypothetical protein